MGNLFGKTETETQITVNAPLEAAWKVLSDVERFSEWNDVIRVKRSQKQPTNRPLQAGHEVNVAVQVEQGGFTLKTPVQLEEYATNKSLSWSGKPGIAKYLVDGFHYFYLEKVDSHTTRLVHGERFSGIVVFLLKFVFLFIILPRARAGYRRFNQAFKAQVESVHKM